jgi:hypothetical protein
MDMISDEEARGVCQKALDQLDGIKLAMLKEKEEKENKKTGGGGGRNRRGGGSGNAKASAGETSLSFALVA